jgi:hypothetical protein
VSTEPRTATVRVLVAKSLQVDEPDWCTGHDGDPANYKADITHCGPEHVITVNGFETLHAMLAQAPYSEISSPVTALYVEEGNLTGSYTPDEVAQLADALTETANRLRTLGQELTAILERGETR